MSSNGKFRVDRRTFDDWTAEEKPWCALALWIYMIGRAQFKRTPITYRHHSFFLDRGQFVTSESHLCKAAGWTRKRLRIFLSRCQKDGKIVSAGTWNGTVITIVNYDKWQSPVSTKGPTSTQLQPSVTPSVGPKGPTKGPTSTQLQPSVTPSVGPASRTTEYLMSLVSKKDKEKDFSFHSGEQPTQKQKADQEPKHAKIDDVWQANQARPEPGPEPSLVHSYIPKANHEGLGQLHKRMIAAAGTRCEHCSFNGGYEQGGHCTSQVLWDKDRWKAISTGLPAVCLAVITGTGGEV
jgi:hypothetical protein